MASGKRGRRPGGHPAKVAAQRERDRERREGRSPAATLRRLAASICQEAATFRSALEAEQWASALLGTWWPLPIGADAEERFEAEVGRPLVAAIGQVGGAGGLAALHAFAEVCDTQLGFDAQEEANRLLHDGAPWPAWGDAMVDVEILRTAVLRERVFDDGITVLIEARHGEEELHVVGVYIDHNLGGMAKDVLLAESIDQIERTLAAGQPDELAAIELKTIPPAEAGARIRAAMELTDMTIDPPVNEDYAPLRALAMLRTDTLPGGDVDVEIPEMTLEERDELLADFLAAPEAGGIPAGSDGAEVVRTAIDFAVGYAGGDPLRWSPVVIELYMADWLPRKLLADRAMFEAVPDALDAWVRYAGRVRGIPAAAVALNTAAIPDWTATMLAGADDDQAAGPAKQFMLAAQEAGIDLADPQAINAFMADWNNRDER